MKLERWEINSLFRSINWKKYHEIHNDEIWTLSNMFIIQVDKMKIDHDNINLLNS